MTTNVLRLEHPETYTCIAQAHDTQLNKTINKNIAPLRLLIPHEINNDCFFSFKHTQYR